MEKNFYKLHRLKKADIDLIRFLIIDKSPACSKANHERFLELITLPARFVDENRDTLKNIEKIEEALNVYLSNILEDHHSRIESSFAPLLEKIIAGDISFYSSDEHCIAFSYYISTQYMRTKSVKEKIIADLKEKSHIDLTKVWPILSEFLSENIASALFVERKRRKLILIENSTDVEFITGDQPVINLDGKYPEPTSKLYLYYPISPRLALVLNEVDAEPTFTTETLDAAKVKHLNDLIFKSAFSQIFAASKTSIEALITPTA